jgi:hypothetical protein
MHVRVTAKKRLFWPSAKLLNARGQNNASTTIIFVLTQSLRSIVTTGAFSCWQLASS